jgi:hypothetical protein
MTKAALGRLLLFYEYYYAARSRLYLGWKYKGSL